MTITIDDSQLKTLTAKAILDAITPETREALIKDAIASLLNDNVNPDRFGAKRSRLQEVFDQSTNEVCREVVREHLKTDPAFRAKLHGVFVAAVEKVFDSDENQDKLVSAIADTITTNLKLDRW